jgi:hypothetical protein
VPEGKVKTDFEFLMPIKQQHMLRLSALPSEIFGLSPGTTHPNSK